MNPVSEITILRRNIFTKVARWALNRPLDQGPSSIDMAALVKELIPDGPARYRCCIYKERAIVEERIRIVIGEAKTSPITIISEACNGCSLNKYIVTDACQNCVAHPCRNSCPKKIISVIQNRAFIDQNSCVECGKCAKACPYNAIIEITRPCERACTIKAIKVDDSRKAVLDMDKCVSCGMCVTVCPFGAITDTSQMLNVIDSLRKQEQPRVAIIAPAIAGQFGPKVTPGHIKSALLRLGFDRVVEAALGADQVAKEEAEEIKAHYDAGLMTNSCCPAYARAIVQKMPELTGNLSACLSPMKVVGQLVKKQYEDKVTTVFIGPCIAKKAEAADSREIDWVLTFEELAALLQAAEIDPAAQLPADMQDASPYGRLFARSGGVSAAVQRHLSGILVDISQVQGLSQCLTTLKLSAKKTDGNGFTFIEGMACEGGCIGGPGTMVSPAVAGRALEKYAGPLDTAKERDDSQITA
ncbi:monomeric [FeFe] hydrogenase [Desulforamulus ruminis]|uniref:monomeric [FeFe] hydrogenase n=1 Tax=Desulforamulus ruminis TaxID=1564 RepID=UPI00235779DC|nr:monomeric [FeFe] hydrogenase [Desulforamulus ruminis]